MQHGHLSGVPQYLMAPSGQLCLMARKQGERDKVPKGEKEGVCGQKSSEVW